ncbi:hypothetical protein [Paenibacillus sp. NRS-1760]|uniref:hypothetical protein n=1 Tax=Paenibacillus sp. NRS-1760 TaxID=3233902 RepID=UPI003D29F9AB
MDAEKLNAIRKIRKGMSWGAQDQGIEQLTDNEVFLLDLVETLLEEAKQMDAPMIGSLKSTYYHIPRQRGELERALHVSSTRDEYRLRLAIYSEFGEGNFTAGHIISAETYELERYKDKVEEMAFNDLMHYAKEKLNL